MKIPAIKGKIGSWTYYTANFTFQQVSELIKDIDNELHQSESLRDQIQRSITENYLQIKSYILTQQEHFFNALVLAVYNGSPKWVEVELNFGEDYYYNLGMQEFEGHEKIFAVDGQHRVKGIKEALKERETLKMETIPVILIGHQNTSEGMEKSRRLFSTLNRYAKPVKPNDIIALDEDDTVAIISRYLLEEHQLFAGNRVNNKDQKAIPDSDKNSFTSLITLYQCNNEILKYFIQTTTNTKLTPLALVEYLKYRKSDETLEAFKNVTFGYWDSFIATFEVIQQFLKEDSRPAEPFRNSKSGGNVLFRPVGLLPFVIATLDIAKRTKLPLNEILKKFENLNMELGHRPWVQVLWNPITKTMLMGSGTLVRLLFIYLYDQKLLSNTELDKLKRDYAGKINYNVANDPNFDLALANLSNNS